MSTPTDEEDGILVPINGHDVEEHQRAVFWERQGIPEDDTDARLECLADIREYSDDWRDDGQGFNQSLATHVTYAYHRGITDRSDMEDFVRRLCARAGRSPEEASKEVQHAVKDQNGIFAKLGGDVPYVPAPKGPRYSDAEVQFNARVVADGQAVSSPTLIPTDPTEQFRLILSSFYEPTDLVQICPRVDQGITKKVETWLEQGPPEDGNWWVANPLTHKRNHRAADADVAACRFLMLESDRVALDHQLRALLATGLKPAWAVKSGGKSIHVVFRVDAPDAQAMKAVGRRVIEALAALGPDHSTYNAAQVQRLPGVMRTGPKVPGGAALQELVYCDPSAPVLDDKRLEKAATRLMTKLSKVRMRHQSELIFSRERAAVPVIEGLLSSDSLAFIYGPPGCGKSFLAMDAGMHVAMGKTWRGEVDPRRTVRCPVLYIALEGEVGAVKRLHAFKERYGVGPEVPFVLSDAPLNLQEPTAVRDLTVLLQTFAADPRIGRYPGVIIIDTLSQAIGGNENDPLVMTTAMKVLGAIKRLTGALVWAVHHTGKDATKGARGHSSLLGAADTMLEVWKDEDGVATLTVAKQKDDAPHRDIVFELEQVEVGPGYWPDKPETTCLVRHLPPDQSSGKAEVERRKKKEKLESDVQIYHKLLACLPQDSQASWAKAAGIGSASTLSRLLGRLGKSGFYSHLVLSDGKIVRSAEMLPTLE